MDGGGSGPQALTAPVSGLQPNTTYHYRLDATSANGTQDGIDREFTTRPSPSSALTANATQITGTSATLNGTVDPAGLQTSVYFDYGPTSAYGSSTPAQDGGDATAAEPASAAVTGLSGASVYHFRVVAVNQAGTFYGPDQTLSTLPPAPTVTTVAASFVEATAAQLNGTAVPNGGDTTVSFEYGLSASYGAQTSSQDVGSGTSATAASSAISGLEPGTTYHYRLDATNANGTTFGADQTFTTGAGSPIVTTQAADMIGPNAASLHATVDPQQQSSSAYFQYGTTPAYGSQTANHALPGNLVPNPGCARGSTSGWAIGGVAAQRFASDTGWASVGPAACRFTTTSLPSGGYSEADVTPAIQGVADDTQYSVSVDLNVLGVAVVQRIVLYVTWLDAAGDGLAKAQVAATGTTGMQTLSGTLSPPANATAAQLDITVEGGGTSDLYFDNAQLLVAGSGSLQSVSSQLPNLAPNTTYHYRAVAVSALGTSYGSDQSFTTAGPLVTSTVLSAPATGSKGTAIPASSILATLSGAGAGAGGTLGFTVFGPRTAPPTNCTSGGTQVGTPLTASGSGAYPASAGYSPSTAGTYWWYAAYSGDATDAASNSGCGSMMPSTTITNPTTVTTGASTAGMLGQPIAASSVTAKLAGAVAGAGGTMSFTVFGPQPAPPANCTSGGTQLGHPVGVNGNGVYPATAGLTPSATGDYWWYASYSGDAKDAPATSACGAAMGEMAVYGESSAAAATDTAVDTATTTSSFTVAPNTTYLLLVGRHSQAADSIASVSSPGLTPSWSLSSLKSIRSQTYNTINHQWSFYLTTPAGAGGTGAVTVSFGKSAGAGGSTIIDVIALAGNNTSSPVVTANTNTSSGTGTAPGAKLPNAPGPLNAEFLFVGAQQDMGANAAATPAMASPFYSDQAVGSAAVFNTAPSQRTEALGLGASVSWGTLAFEIQPG